MTDDKIEELTKKMLEKNPDFIRDLMSSFWIRFENVEASQGKITKIGKVEKHYRENK